MSKKRKQRKAISINMGESRYNVGRREMIMPNTSSITIHDLSMGGLRNEDIIFTEIK